MKRIRLILSLIIMCLCFVCIDCFASTKVNIRTEGNYLVPSDVIVTESIKESILSTPAINVDEKIYDFADLLTDSEEMKLYNQAKQFIDGTKVDMVIVTAREYNKASMKDYAHDFYKYNDFKRDGVLLFIDMKVRGVYMVVEGRAYDIFTDARMNPLLESAYNSLVKGNYYKSCSNFIKSSGDFVNIGIAEGDESVRIGEDGSVIVGKDLHFFEVAMFALVGTIVIIGVMILSNNLVHKAKSSKEFLNRETIRIINISEMYLGSKTTKRNISESSSNSRIGSSMDNKSGGTGRKF